MKVNKEKLIKEILASVKIHKFVIDEDGKLVSGDVKALKNDLLDFDTNVEDVGIGHYDYGSHHGVDSQLELNISGGQCKVEITAAENYDPKDLTDILVKIGKIKNPIHIHDEENNVRGNFKLTVGDDYKENNGVHTFSLYYDNE